MRILKDKKIVKLLTILVVFVCFMCCINNSYAVINEDYAVDSVVIEEKLDEKVSASVLLDALGSLLYALSSLGEYLIGVIFKAIAGSIASRWSRSYFSLGRCNCV